MYWRRSKREMLTENVDQMSTENTFNLSPHRQRMSSRRLPHQNKSFCLSRRPFSRFNSSSLCWTAQSRDMYSFVRDGGTPPSSLALPNVPVGLLHSYFFSMVCVGQKRFQIRAREPQWYSKLVKAHSRLYRWRCLQVNIHFTTCILQ